MNIRKIIQRRIRHSGDGVEVVGDLNAAISANVNERGGSSNVSSKQRVVQHDSRTVISGQSDEGGASGGSRGEV